MEKYWKLESLARDGGIIFFILLCNPRLGQLTSDLSFLTGKRRTAVMFVRSGRSCSIVWQTRDQLSFISYPARLEWKSY